MKYYTNNIASYTDYYPFGMTMPGRSFTSENYRYGFNGMEKADDIASGNYTTPFREIDTRLGGRWWSQDPIVKPWESPYAGFSNNPIVFSDPSGLNSKNETGGDDGKCTDCGMDSGRGSGETPEEVGEVVVTAERQNKTPELPYPDKVPVPGLPNGSLENKVAQQNVSNEFNRRQKNEQSRTAFFNKLLSDYDLRGQLINEIAKEDYGKAVELHQELFMADYNRSGQQASVMFLVSITAVSPVPGDEYIAAGMATVSRSAMRTTITVIERYVPKATMRLLTDPVMKTVIVDESLMIGDRYVTGVLFKNKYRFQFQKGRFYGGKLTPHINLSNGTKSGNLHIFTTKEGISKYGLFGGKL